MSMISALQFSRVGMLVMFLVWVVLVGFSNAVPVDRGVERSSIESTAGLHEITVNASVNVGKLKNLQGTNNGDTSLVAPGLDTIHDMVPAIADLWPQNGIQHVLIYTWPDVFMGFGKSGTAGDASRNENYNWTITDEYVHFVTSHGAKASIQFHPANGTNDTFSSPEKLGQIGFMITDRYVNGAHDSGFENAIELFDFYAESDLSDAASSEEAYKQLFRYFAGFTHGVANASSKAGVGAWGGNRILPPHTNYSLYDPFVSRFYTDCKRYNIPIKAATYHFSNAQFSFDPYDIKVLTDKFRSEILAPAGLPDLPVWVTEFEPNPSGIQPTSAAATRDYNDPAFFASFTLGTTMYAQDTSVEQTMPWTGFGYGGIGAGNAAFQPWFNLTSTNETVPLNVAAAWKLQADLILNTPDRVALNGSSPNGFAALAGRSGSKDKVQVLLNNYQPNYDILREIAAQSVPLFNTSTTAYPPIQLNGLFNGEQACFKPGTQFFVPVCQTYVQPTIRNNTSTAYKLIIENLPWDKTSNYELQIQRVGGGMVHQIFHIIKGVGNSINITVPFPANAQDLISVSEV